MLSVLLIQFFTITFILGTSAWLFWRRPKNFPPGPLPLPVIGNLHQIGLEPHKSLTELARKYGNVFAVDMASFRCVVLNDNKSIKEALSMDEFSGRPKFKSFIDRTGGHERGLAMTSGRAWVEQRRFTLKTMRAFGFGKKSMEGIIQEEIKHLIQLFDTKIGQSLSMENIFNGPMLNSLWHITTGERCDYSDPLFGKIIRALIGSVSESMSMAVWLFNFFPAFAKFFPNWSGYNQFMKVFASANEIIQTVLDKHQAHPQVDGKPRDFVDAYMQEISNEKDATSSFFGKVGESNLNFTLQDMFMAGVETTGTALSWTFFLLAHHQKEQDKLFAEIHAVVGNSKVPALADREKMTYTQALIMEVLRFSAVLPIVPHSTLEDVEFQGYFIPKDTVVLLNIYGASHDENVWVDPYSFCPARFISPEGELNRKQESFIAFSSGKRFCPGKKLAWDELFLFTTALVQKFKMSFDQSRAVPGINEILVGVMNAPKGHSLILEER